MSPSYDPIQTPVPEKAAVYMCAVAKYMMLLLLLSQWWILVQIPQTWMTALLSSAIINTRSTLTMTLHVVIRQLGHLVKSFKLCWKHIFSDWNNPLFWKKAHILPCYCKDQKHAEVIILWYTCFKGSNLSFSHKLMDLKFKIMSITCRFNFISILCWSCIFHLSMLEIFFR